MDLKLWCDNCIKFQVFEGAQDIFIRLTAVCCMFLPHNPYILPQHYKRHVYGPSCSCKHLFLWISDFWALVLSELYGYSVPLTFLVNSCSSFHMPLLIFQPTTNCIASNNQNMPCHNIISQLGKMCSCCVSTYIYIYIGVFGWVWEVEGYILAPESKPDLQGSCSIARDSSLPNRSEQNLSKLPHTVCDIFIICSAI